MISSKSIPREMRVRLGIEPPSKQSKPRQRSDRARMALLTSRCCELLGVTRLPEGVTPREYPSSPNKWEAEWLKKIESTCKLEGIADWVFNPLRFEIGIGAYFTPDIVIRFQSGQIQCLEIKGFRHASGIVRLKVAAKWFSNFDWVIVEKKDGCWVKKEIKR